MNTINVGLVQRTWDMMAPIADEASRMFYDRLFELDPSLRAMFANANMDEQRQKVVQTITVAVHSLGRLHELMPAVEELGRKHAGYGVKKRHYATAGAALFDMLEWGLGDAFTAEARESWTNTYTTLAEAMQRAGSDRAA
jgi:hemoglobin-like flavoprotein